MRSGWHYLLMAIAILPVAVTVPGCGGGGGGGGGGSTVTVNWLNVPGGALTVKHAAVVDLSVSASATNGISRVVFTATPLAGGSAIALGTDTTAPYQVAWDTTPVAVGQYRVTATAYDKSSPAKSKSASITVTVESTGITVALTVNKSTPKVGETVTCTATASAPAGIQRVVFYVNGANPFVDSASPDVVQWGTAGLTPGAYVIKALAYDKSTPALVDGAVRTVQLQPADTQPPTVEITSPANGGVAVGTCEVRFTATAQAGATITKVDVTFGTATQTVMGGSQTLTGSTTFNTIAMDDVSYPVTAQATDSNGRLGSATITVNVMNSVAPPPPPVF